MSHYQYKKTRSPVRYRLCKLNSLSHLVDCQLSFGVDAVMNNWDSLVAVARTCMLLQMAAQSNITKCMEHLGWTIPMFRHYLFWVKAIKMLPENLCSVPDWFANKGAASRGLHIHLNKQWKKYCITGVLTRHDAYVTSLWQQNKTVVRHTYLYNEDSYTEKTPW